MSISILIKPERTGYRATTGGPFDLAAEAATLPDAVAALRAKISDCLGSGAVLIEQSFAPTSPVAITPLAKNPLFDDWLRAVDNYRDQCDVEVSE